MSKDVERAPHWPADQWHPAYASVREWLDNEAPRSTVDNPAKRRNQRHLIKLWKRRA